MDNVLYFCPKQINTYNMKDQIVNIETAILAKEKGFTSPCTHFYVIGYANMERDENVRQFSNPWGDNKFLQPCKVGKGQPHLALAPTQSLLQRWLREVHKIDVVLDPERFTDGVNYCVQAQKFDLVSGELEENFTVDGSCSFNDNGEYPTYEDAMEKGLYEALKLIKE